MRRRGRPRRADHAERTQAARNHRRWVDIAAALGCHAIRVNIRDDQSDPDALRERAAEALGAILAYTAGELRILLENHGGLSSDPDWLLSLIRLVNDPGLGTLPGFGNFPPEVDRYDAVAKLMPLAGDVSAKCYDFDGAGRETTIDFARMMAIVRAAGYQGFIGVEYEGTRLPEREGILAAKRLLTAGGSRQWATGSACSSIAGSLRLVTTARPRRARRPGRRRARTPAGRGCRG